VPQGRCLGSASERVEVLKASLLVFYHEGVISYRLWQVAFGTSAKFTQASLAKRPEVDEVKLVTPTKDALRIRSARLIYVVYRPYETSINEIARLFKPVSDAEELSSTPCKRA
jgi:hypothetical protein